MLGSWIGFRVAPKVAVLTKTLRLMLEQLLKNKIRDPTLDLSGGASQTVLNAISMLMARNAGKTKQQQQGKESTFGSTDAVAHPSAAHELLSAMSEADRRQQELLRTNVSDSGVPTEDLDGQRSQDTDRPLGPEAAWACHVCTFVNLPRLHGERSHCKMCETQRAKPSRDQALQWKHKCGFLFVSCCGLFCCWLYIFFFVSCFWIYCIYCIFPCFSEELQRVRRAYLHALVPQVR